MVSLCPTMRIKIINDNNSHFCLPTSIPPRVRAVPRSCRTSGCSRSSDTSIASHSGTPHARQGVGRVRHLHGYARYSRSTRAPNGFPRSGRRPSSLPASRPSPVSAARPMPNATSAASRSSSLSKKAAGIWSATTRRSFLARHDAAGAALFIRRRAAVPPRRQPPPHPGERAALFRWTAFTATARCGRQPRRNHRL